MTDTFSDVLLAIARVLAEFCDTAPSGALKWDGKAYTTSTNGPSDLQAAKWWGTLTALAGMLDAQTTPLTSEQRTYLDKLLFGGMGSLNDLVLDEHHLGSRAKLANQELDRLRKELFTTFQLL